MGKSGSRLVLLQPRWISTACGLIFPSFLRLLNSHRQQVDMLWQLSNLSLWDMGFQMKLCRTTVCFSQVQNSEHLQRIGSLYIPHLVLDFHSQTKWTSSPDSKEPARESIGKPKWSVHYSTGVQKLASGWGKTVSCTTANGMTIENKTAYVSTAVENATVQWCT